MQTLRYAVALMLVVFVPAAIVFWFLIHPLVRFWRRLGAWRSYAAICTLVAGVMAGMVLLRTRLLGVDWGMSYPLAGLGLTLLIVSGALLRTLHRHLPTRVLIGVPEISPGQNAGKPITEGIYARIRHPRYVQMTLAILGYALIANFPASYGALLLWCAGIYAVILIEERELTDRFGNVYRDYCRRVPRFVPRLRKK